MNNEQFEVVEYLSFFAVHHLPTGEEKPMGDGVDSLFDSDGNAYKPGTPGFVDIWTEAVKHSGVEILEAYFPELVDYGWNDFSKEVAERGIDILDSDLQERAKWDHLWELWKLAVDTERERVARLER